MWKLIRSVFSTIWGSFAKLGSAIVMGLAFWVIFVSEIMPPEKSPLRAFFLTLLSVAAIMLVAGGLRDFRTKPPRKENREDRPALLTLTKPAGKPARAENPQEKH